MPAYRAAPYKDVFEGIGLEMVDDPAEATFVVNTGIDDFDETIADYDPILKACASRSLPMVCANPDLVVVVGTKMAICAGMLARRYEEFGGSVRYHGKPHAPVYRRCFDLLGIHDRQRIAAVGDSFRTDVAGANAAGIDAVLVTSGIHLEELATAWGEHPDSRKLAAAAAASGDIRRPPYRISAGKFHRRVMPMRYGTTRRLSARARIAGNSDHETVAGNGNMWCGYCFATPTVSRAALIKERLCSIVSMDPG